MSKVIQWFPGHMAKAKKNIAADIALVDLSIIVLDARVPKCSYNPDFEAILNKKPRLIVLNKEDLADPNLTARWVDYYKSKGFGVVTMNASGKQGVDKLLRAAQAMSEPVMQKLEEKGRLRRCVRALVAGAPNTGKSTLINAMMPYNIAKAANRPGVTRGRQWVRVNEKIEMMDTPGILWPKLDNQEIGMRLSYCGCIPQDIFDGEEVGMNLLAWLVANAPQALEQRYRIEIGESDLYEVLNAIGKSRGLLAPGGRVKERDTALLLLAEFRNGKLGRFTLDLPPEA